MAKGIFIVSGVQNLFADIIPVKSNIQLSVLNFLRRVNFLNGRNNIIAQLPHHPAEYQQIPHHSYQHGFYLIGQLIDAQFLKVVVMKEEPALILFCYEVIQTA